MKNEVKTCDICKLPNNELEECWIQLETSFTKHTADDYIASEPGVSLVSYCAGCKVEALINILTKDK